MEERVLAERYRLIEELDQGGMGSVWRAEHIQLGTPAAVKLIDPKIATDEEALARFKREAQAAATLRSPHVVQILDYGVDGETPFIAMELLEGESLEDRLSRLGRLTPAMTARILTHVARALTKAHEIGVVHRDLKPDNIYIVKNDDEEIAKVLDFGIAKQTDDGLAGPGKVQTKTGAMLGTPYYMSPEQTSGKRPVDHRTDIWAVGVLAYECLTGQLPFEDDILGGLVLAICTEEPRPPSQVWDVPVGFDGWFARATRKDPDERFQSAKEATKLLTVLCNPEAGRDALESFPEEQLLASLGIPVGGASRSAEAAPIVRHDALPTIRNLEGPSAAEAAEQMATQQRPLSAFPIPLVPRARRSEGSGTTAQQLSPSAVTVRSSPSGTGGKVALAALGLVVVAAGVGGAWHVMRPDPAPPTTPAAVTGAPPPVLEEPPFIDVPLPEFAPPPAREAEPTPSASASATAPSPGTKAKQPRRPGPRSDPGPARPPRPSAPEPLDSELGI